MKVRSKSEAEIQERNRMRTHVLMDAGELGSRNLCVTWSEIEPGASQADHAHMDSEQVYVILDGAGRMTVAGDSRDVSAGDLVFVHPGALHSIENSGEETLEYVTAAAPAFSIEELHRTQLAPEVDEYLDDEI